MKKILVSLLVMGFGLCAYAANWERINDKIYVDTSSITTDAKSGSVVSFWAKELNDGGDDFAVVERTYFQKVWYDLVRYSLDCSSRKFKIEDVLIYGLQNNLIANDSSSTGGWNVIPPQSIAEDYLELVCKYKPQAQNAANDSTRKDIPKTETPKTGTQGSLTFTEFDPKTAPAIRNNETKLKSEVKPASPAELDAYMKALQAKIVSNWHRPECDKALKVTLVFSIAKEGTLITMSEFKGSGNQDFDNAASDAVKNSVPFAPLPGGQSNGIDVQVTFGENVRGFILSGK